MSGTLAALPSSMVQMVLSRRAVLSLALSIALVASACGGDNSGAAEPEGTPVGGPGVPASPGGAAVSPPAASATSAGGVAQLGIGSYCWGTPGGGTAACVDKIGVITKTQALTATRGSTVSVANPVSGASIEEASVRAFPATGQPLPVAGGEQAWPYPQAGVVPLSVSRPSGAAAGLDFAADLQPGRYVVDIHLRYPQGSVSYGLLLEVR